MPHHLVERIELIGLHGHQNIQESLKPGLNILHGRNGSGKTTCLHVLANLFERDIQRFCHIHFKTIRVRISRGHEIELIQHRSGTDRPAVEILVDKVSYQEIRENEEISLPLDQLLRDRLGGRSVYLPAFRSILEGAPEYKRAGRSYERGERDPEFERTLKREVEEIRRQSPDMPRYRFGPVHDRAENITYKTIQCRRWFGGFVPIIRYPSLADVHDEMHDEIQGATFDVAKTDQETLSSVFVHVLEAVLAEPSREDKDDINAALARVQENLAKLNPSAASVHSSYEQIQQLLQSSAPKLSSTNAGSVLRVYEQALRTRAEVEARAFAPIRVFLDSVNKFIQPKLLTFELRPARATRGPGLKVTLQDGRSSNLSVLSSGERHVLTLLFAATHMSSADSIVLIDEPELSLHVDWQRIILSELMNQVGERQIIACTHAPEVGADHRDSMVPLKNEMWTPDGTDESACLEDTSAEA